jgi:hypothetical protein
MENKTEYPKWVEPHPKHIAPGFSEYFVDHRERKITVLVRDLEEEKKALAEPKGAPSGR